MSKIPKLRLTWDLPCPDIKHDDICTSLILTNFLVTPKPSLSDN